MRKSGQILAVIIMAGILSGCSSLDNIEHTTVSVGKEGTITETIVEKGSPDREELADIRKFVEQEVQNYNQNSRSGTMELKNIKTDEEYLRVRILYDSWEDYTAYHNVEFFCGTVTEAETKGFDFAGDFQNISGEKETGKEVMASYAESKVVILQEPVTVVVPGKIMFVSDHVKIKDQKTAEISEDQENHSGDYLNLLGSPSYIIYK